MVFLFLYPNHNEREGLQRSDSRHSNLLSQVRQDHNGLFGPGLIQVPLGERSRTDAARSLGMS